MDQKLAVLFMPDDMTLTKEKTPLMLRPILFCPILTWIRLRTGRRHLC